MRSLLLAVLVAAAPAAALGQAVCPYGLVAVDGTHCCWPGQSYDAARSACAGAPQCPAGLAPYGETCVAGQPQAVQPVQPVAPVQPAALPPPPAPVAGPVAPAPLPVAPAPQPYQPQPGYAQPQPVPAYAQPTPAMAYPAKFEAERGGDFTVILDGGQSCRTPCTLNVVPGRQRVRFEGDASYGERFNFPASPSTIKIGRRGAGGKVLKGVGLGVGIPLTVVGAVFTVSTLVAREASYGTDAYHWGHRWLPLSATAFAVGLTMTIAMPIIGGVVGGKDSASLEVDRTAGREDAPALQFVAAGAVPVQGGGMVGATFVF